MDVVPGHYNTMGSPHQARPLPFFCSQYCGKNHALMAGGGRVTVMDLPTTRLAFGAPAASTIPSSPAKTLAKKKSLAILANVPDGSGRSLHHVRHSYLTSFSSSLTATLLLSSHPLLPSNFALSCIFHLRRFPFSSSILVLPPLLFLCPPPFFTLLFSLNPPFSPPSQIRSVCRLLARREP